MKQKIFIAIIAILVSNLSISQVSKIQLQAAGLTCSMCSKAVFKSISAIAFVKDVKADIKTSSYTIQLKDENVWDFDAFKNAVEGAGFSVAKLSADVNFTNVKIEKDAHLKYSGKTFHFLNGNNQTLNGVYTVNIVDKDFVTSKEFKTNSKLTLMKCYDTGKMESCCSKSSTNNSSNRIYHLILKN